jgi:hypothetical protein
MVVAQPETSQTASASLVIIFIVPPKSRATATLSRSGYADNVCHAGKAVKMLRCNQNSARQGVISSASYADG